MLIVVLVLLSLFLSTTLVVLVLSHILLSYFLMSYLLVIQFLPPLAILFVIAIRSGLRIALALLVLFLPNYLLIVMPLFIRS